MNAVTVTNSGIWIGIVNVRASMIVIAVNPATMNANARTLLQVRVEDAVEADEVFTTLMGDEVEPRRDFIERNALEVRNLDV